MSEVSIYSYLTFSNTFKQGTRIPFWEGILTVHHWIYMHITDAHTHACCHSHPRQWVSLLLISGRYHIAPNSVIKMMIILKSVLQKLHLQSFKYFTWYECNNLESIPSVLKNSRVHISWTATWSARHFPEGILKYNTGTFPADM